jgi:hypothetical protein
MPIKVERIRPGAALAEQACAEHGSNRWGLGSEPSHSAGVPRALGLAWALQSLRTLPFRRGPATVNDQAVAPSSALVAYGAVPQSRGTAALARRGQFFIHLII